MSGEQARWCRGASAGPGGLTVTRAAPAVPRRVAAQHRPSRVRNADLSGPAGPPVGHGRRVRLASVPRVTGLLAAGDLLAIAVAATAVRPGWVELAYAFGAFLSLAIGREHRNRLALRLLDEVPRLVGRLLLPLLVVGSGAVVTEVSAAVLRQTVATVVLVLAVRAVSYATIRSQRRKGRLSSPTVVLGAGAIGLELVEILTAHPEYGLRPVGIVDDVPRGPFPPVLGQISDLHDVIASNDVTHMVVAFGPTREQDLVRVLRQAVSDDVRVYLVPRFFEIGLAPTGPEVETVWGIPLYRVRQAALRESAFRIKRVADVALSGSALLVLSPVLAVLAVLVRLSSPGPVLFKQCRIGQGGRQFDVLKFRTLREQRASDELPVGDDADGVQRQRLQDVQRRVTPIGRFLRRTCLDEVPQLWNIVRGDMSLVGPRPEERPFVERFEGSVRGYADRHRLPVGLTGLAQVHGLRGDTSIEVRSRFDNYYVEHWSPWQDFVILLRTLGAVVRHDASRPGSDARP